MNLPFLAIRAFPHWNKRPVTEREVRHYCARRGVRIVEGDVGVPGLYTVYGGVPFIVIHPALAPAWRLWVLLHELAHHLLHAPGTQLFDRYFETKADHEANFIAAIGMLTLPEIQTKTFNELLEEGYPHELLLLRREYFERYKM